MAGPNVTLKLLNTMPLLTASSVKLADIPSSPPTFMLCEVRVERFVWPPALTTTPTFSLWAMKSKLKPVTR